MLNCFGEVTRATASHVASEARFAVARQALDAWPDWLASLHDAAGTGLRRYLLAARDHHGRARAGGGPGAGGASG
ncbi:hypothetical protein [Streptomyces sp. B6B3]|uniref:hypothetical protein n=1 Tax=Streptomyces sp. B6B3 TaxID=3153570 RepID=UPI00325D0BE2